MWRPVEDGKLREGGSTMTVGKAAGNAGRGGGWFCDGEGTSDVVGTGGDCGDEGTCGGLA